MVCLLSFRIPETGNQGIAVGPLPSAAKPVAPPPSAQPAAPPPAAKPVTPPPAASPSPFAAATPAAFPGAAGLASSSDIDYKNTATIRLTRSTLLGAGGPKPATPFASGLIPPPPAKSVPVSPKSALPTAAPVAAPTPAPAPDQAQDPDQVPGAVVPTPAPTKAAPSGRIPNKKMTIPARSGKPLGQGAAVQAPPATESSTYISPPPTVIQKGGVAAVDLVLALIPVLLAAVCPVLAIKFGSAVLAAGIGGGVGLLCWLGILFRSMIARNK